MPLLDLFRMLGRRLRPRPEAVDLTPWRERLTGPLPEEDFTRLMAELVQRLPGVREVRVAEPLMLEVRTRRLAHALQLAVIFSELPETWEAREAHLRFFLGSVAEALAEDGGRRGRRVDPERIVPLVWGREALEAAPLEHLVHAPLVADLHVVYALDQPHSFGYLLPEERARLGLDDAGLRQLAVANLTRLLPPLELHGEASLFMVTAGGNYEASLLLVDDVWEQLGTRVEGRLLACALARDLLYVTGEDAPGGPEALDEAVAQAWPRLTRAISRTVLVREGGQWVPRRPFLMQ